MNRVKDILMALLCSCLGTLALKAAEAAPGAAPEFGPARQLCERLMGSLSKGRASEAGALVRTNWYKPEEAETVGAKLENEFQATEVKIGPDAGKRLGTYECVGLCRWGASAVKFVYVQRYEYAPLLWAIALYHAPEGWKLVAISLGPESLEDSAGLEIAASASDYTALRPVPEGFLAPLSAGLGNEAFAALKKAPWTNPEPAGFALTKLEDQYRSASAKFKQEIGNRLPGGAYEWVAAKRLGNSLLSLFYNEQRERGFLMWQFTFYRAQEEWKLEAVSYGSDISPGQRAAAAVCVPTP